MATNLYDAHRQWAFRPPDERFSPERETPNPPEGSGA